MFPSRRRANARGRTPANPSAGCAGVRRSAYVHRVSGVELEGFRGACLRAPRSTPNSTFGPGCGSPADRVSVPRQKSFARRASPRLRRASSRRAAPDGSVEAAPEAWRSRPRSERAIRRSSADAPAPGFDPRKTLCATRRKRRRPTPEFAVSAMTLSTEKTIDVRCSDR